jgi:dTDP-glucose 4,6-dehydratase
MATLLVTGGSGFIGSNFISYYLERHSQDSILNLDKLTCAASRENLKKLKNNPRHIFVKGDICDKAAVSKLIKKADYVLNFAAETHVDRSIETPDDFIRTNVYGTFILLDAARANNIRRFIQISTDEVYGEKLNGRSSETDVLKPGNPYAASKASADMLALSFFHTYNLPIIITRTCNNFGPGQAIDKLIPRFITQLSQGEKIPLYGDGRHIREWIYVEDNCRAIDLVLNKGKVGEIYNIGTGVLMRNIEVTDLILEIMGRDKTYISYVKDRPGHDRRYCLDSGKIRSLGWKPEHDFNAALKSTLRHYSLK